MNEVIEQLLCSPTSSYEDTIKQTILTDIFKKRFEREGNLLVLRF